jgi:hypothetical protein
VTAHKLLPFIRRATTNTPSILQTIPIYESFAFRLIPHEAIVMFILGSMISAITAVVFGFADKFGLSYITRSDEIGWKVLLGFEVIVLKTAEESHVVLEFETFKLIFHMNLSLEATMVVGSFDFRIKVSCLPIVGKAPHRWVIVASFDIPR